MVSSILLLMFPFLPLCTIPLFDVSTLSLMPLLRLLQITHFNVLEIILKVYKKKVNLKGNTGNRILMSVR